MQENAGNTTPGQQNDPGPTPSAQTTVQPANMASPVAKVKGGRKKDESPFALEIAALEEKLAKARERQREAIRKQQEKNARDVRDLIKSQKWENYSVEVWQRAVDSIGPALAKADDQLKASTT